MPQDTPDKTALQRIESLRRQREKILSLSAEKGLESILDAPQPAALVHSWAEQDLYFLIHDLGPEDAQPLLALVSERQRDYLLDLECWQRDRIDLPAATRWLDLFLRTDPKRLAKWCLTEGGDFVAFYLFRNIVVRVREHDQDPSDFGPDFFTIDDTFYIRVLDGPTPTEDRDAAASTPRDLIPRLIERLADEDYPRYQQLIQEAMDVLPAEHEEELYRMRNVRLAEKGFLPPKKAVGVYQPLNAHHFKDQPAKYVSPPQQTFPMVVPLVPAGMLQDDNLFTRSLQRIDADRTLQQLQAEFAALCNQIISADGRSIRDREELREIVGKACGYLSLGLEVLCPSGSSETPGRSSALIQIHGLIDIFRLGYGQALSLKWRAEQWHRSGWFGATGLPLSFWAEEGMGVLGGLLLKKPLFFDNYRSGKIYREFTCGEDLSSTAAVLDDIIALDDLIGRMALRGLPRSELLLTYKSLLLTLWAADRLGLEETAGTYTSSDRPIALPLEAFKTFFEGLWRDVNPPRKARQSVKEDFLRYLADRSAQPAADVSDRLGHTLETLFAEIEGELGRVATRDLDPRFVHLFILQIP